jgi:hypothetical protein
MNPFQVKITATPEVYHVKVNISPEQAAKLFRDEAEGFRNEALDFKNETEALKDETISIKEQTEEFYKQTVRERRHDYVHPHSFLGNAPLGSLDSDPVWIIYKILVNEDGSSSKTKAENVAWTDRLTINYN